MNFVGINAFILLYNLVKKQLALSSLSIVNQ